MKRLFFAFISCWLLLVAAWFVVGLKPSQAREVQQSRTYTSNADFAEGVLVGVESTSVSNQLQLSTEGGIPPYIWVPNQNEGSLSKIDTRDGMEKARYRTGGGSSNPSRTTVDLQGNAWVANRNFATVVKIALAETDCEDRNGNSLIETSRDINSDGNITGAEILDWGKDECVLKEVVVAAGKEGTYSPGVFTNYSSYGDEGARALTIDSSGNVWVGIHRDQKYFNISSANGAILGGAISTATEGHNPYGAVVDRYGNLWSAAYPNAHVVKINLATHAVTKIAMPQVTYGLGLDKNDHLFVSSTEAKLSRVNVVTNQVERTVTPSSWGRGVVVTDDGDVWVANSGSGKLDRWANDLLTQKSAIDVGGSEPAGVAVDAAGKVWVTAKYSGTIRRINPATNAIEITKAVDGTSGHYGYSDMTGKVARTVTTRTGTWTVVYDSGAANTSWGTLRWNGSEPAGTSIKARVRSSANQTSWSSWAQATNGAAFSAIPANRYLQIEVTLQLTTGTASPVLYDLTVSPGGGGGGACTYSVTPMTQTFSGAGGTGTLSVASQTGCSWSAHSNISWITVNTGLSGEGNGTVSYTVAANTGVRMRVGGLAVAGRYVAIVQSDCPVTPLTIPQTVNGALTTTDCRSLVDDNAYADLYSFSGQAGQRIAISLTSANFDAYLTLYGPNGGLLSFNDDDVSSNSRIPRGSDFLILPFSGTYVIDASSYNANETGNYTLSLTTTSEGSDCTYTLTPTSAAFNAAGGSGTINVSTQNGCAWTADSTMGWLTIDAGTSGRGSGVVNYTVAANLSQGYMLGRLFVAGQFVPIVESGTGGNCPITPLTIPQTVNNSWSVGDCANGSGEFTDLYSITVSAGQQVSIALTTTNNLTTLILWGPTGRLVSGYIGDGNKRIPPGTGYFVLPFNGTYIIEVASGYQGSYSLSLNAPSIVPPTCPTISSFTPSSGAVGSTVTITGSNFTDVTAVRFANNVSAQFTVNSATQITAIVPSGAVTGVITLSKANCADVQTSSAFTVTTSTVAELIDHAITGGPLPASCVAPATKSNFAPTDERAYQWSSFVNVKIGDVVRWEFVQPNGTVYDTQQRASEYSGASCFWAWITIAGQPPASLPGDWQVRVSYNGTPMLTERFRILQGTSNCPSVTVISAAAGAVGSTITLTGVNFTGVTAVKFANNVSAQFTINSDTSLTTVIPVGAVTGPITLSKPNCADTTTTIFIITDGGSNCVQPPAGLVGWWPGDGNANDILGGNHGTTQGGVTFPTAQVSQGFNFASDTDRVTAPHNANLNVQAPGFTADYWLKGSKNQPQSLAVVVEKSHGFVDSTGWFFQVESSTGKLTFGIGAGGSSISNFPIVTSVADLLDNNFHFITGTWDGGTIRFYVDGTLQGTQALALPANNTRSLNIGFAAGAGTPQRFFRGVVDELEVFNRALSESEIRSIFNAGSAGKCKSIGNCVQTPGGALGWWPGDGNANDLAGNNHGTLQNGATYASGQVGQAFSFDGVNDVVQVTDAPSLDFSPTASLTVELWAYRTSSNPIMHLVGKRVNCDLSSINYQLAMNTTTSEGLSFGGNGTTGRVSTGMNLPLNTWTHLAGTFDGATFRLYINGQLAGSAFGTLGPTNDAPLLIAGAGSCQTFGGLLDEVSLYNRALSPAEIQSIYNAGSAGKCKTASGCPTITGLNTNRLCNPGAELGQGGTNSDAVVAIPGWTTTSNFTAIVYGLVEFPTLADAQRIGGGLNLFYGGANNASSRATQVVEVSDEATGIDAGQRTAQLQAYLGGYQPEGDNARVSAEFLTPGGTVLGSALTLGPVTGSLQLLSTAGAVPAGTRSIRVTMISTRVGGTYNEGYFDNLSLVLTQSGTTTCPTITNLSPSSGVAGSTVTITGTNFTGVTAVRFANNVSAQFTINSNTQITTTVPSGAVTGVITLSKTGCTDVQTVPFSVTTTGPCIDVVIASNLTAGTGTTLTVPIMASDMTGKGAIAYDATLTYDPAVLRLQNPPTDKTGTLSSNFTITTNIPAAGQLRISGFGSTALAGAGVLLNVKFDVLGAANACSTLSLTSFRFNEGTPCSTTTNGRACVTGGGIISGAVSYCITPKPVPGVAVNVTGSATTSATTNTSGNYTLPTLNSGNYTLTPAKTGDVNGLASFDAALVAQHVVGLNTLNTCQQLAGDTSNNGELSSFDAALIAQYVVGINNAASIAGTWKFVPPTRTYSNLSNNQTNQNFDAVLVGDVSGNWSAGATAFDELARTSSPSQQVSISLPNLSATTGTSVTVPVTVGDLTGKGVIAYDFDLVFDQSVLQAASTPYDAANTLSSALTITANPQPGRLRVSAFGTQSLAGAGTLLNLKFNVLGAGGTSSALTWQRFLLNEVLQTNLTNGRVNVGYAVACVSAASFVGTALASESIVAGFGQGLATRTEVGTTVPLPTSLAGTTVRVHDSAGIERLAPLFFVSSGQVNYQVPPGTAAGPAILIVSSGDGAVSTGTMQIARVMPGLFAANSNGMGVAAAVALRVKTDGSQVYELVATYDAAQQRFVPLPLSLGPEGEQLYLILFGTGARNFSSLANVQARVGGTDTPVAFVGAVEGLIGLDQLNLGPLPRSLAGRGEVNIAVQVDGQTANVVTVSVR